MSMRLKHRVIIYDSEGSPIRDSGLQDSHSFVAGFLALISGIMSGGADVSGYFNLDGWSPSAPSWGSPILTVPNDRYDSLIDDLIHLGHAGDDFGLIVGSESTQEYATNKSLGSQIDSSRLYPSHHYLCEVEDLDSAGFVIIRAFTNITAGKVLIAETGIRVYDLATLSWKKITGYQKAYPYLPIIQWVYEPFNLYGLIIRDILSEQFTVPVGGEATVQYLLRISK